MNNVNHEFKVGETVVIDPYVIFGRKSEEIVTGHIESISPAYGTLLALARLTGPRIGGTIDVPLRSLRPA